MNRLIVSIFILSIILLLAINVFTVIMSNKKEEADKECISNLKEQIIYDSNTILDLSAKIEILESENSALRIDTGRYGIIMERLSKVSPYLYNHVTTNIE